MNFTAFNIDASPGSVHTLAHRLAIQGIVKVTRDFDVFGRLYYYLAIPTNLA
jgi:hypothetical protein